jgi:formylglycine-generating enzyme required for sulfatase activity
MVFVPPGKALIGTTYERLNELLAGRPKEIRKDFAYEVPQHTVDMEGFFADRNETSNAQYLLFMQDTAKASYDTGSGTLANLEEVAGSLMRVPKEHWKDDDTAWRQLYRGNKAKLWEKLPQYIKKDASGSVDEKKTEAAYHYAPLVPGMILDFYDRKPPEIWPELIPQPGFFDHPVMSVSYDDVEAYAEWAGKHVLTENEWEYVARGPEGFLFPWGDEWFADASRANWGGKFTGLNLPKDIQKLLEETKKGRKYDPYTMPVATLPEGRSWCGAYHMLGNAAEWTSSWFGPYPGNERDHAFMGEFVKVIRGASHIDADPLALRPAARNFIGAGNKAPPRPGNRFEYVGFRCGWYGQPGKDQLGPIIRRVSRGRRVTSKNTALDLYVGAAATRFAASEDDVKDDVYVQGKAHSVVFVPMTSVLRPDQEDRARKRKTFLALGSEGKDPIPLGVLHLDVPLDKVYVRAPKTPGASRPKKPKPPEVQKGTCLPGTYILAIWWERPCLCTESLEFQCFLTKGTIKSAAFDVKKLKPEKVPLPEIEIEPDMDTIFLKFAVPVGGKKNDEDLFAIMKTITLNTAEGELTKAGTWRRYQPTKPEPEPEEDK